MILAVHVPAARSCSFCEGWFDETWRTATNRRKYQSRKRGEESCPRGSLTFCRKGGSWACRDISPRVLDHDASAIVRSLPGYVTGHIMTGPFTGYPVSPGTGRTGPDIGHLRTGPGTEHRVHRVQGKQINRVPGHRDQGHHHASRRRSRKYGPLGGLSIIP
ncbi:hypothetical protein DPMN_050087 [Dreissena polymorpha]|uniref:Uncharacterized protein n=1 Tax=Dreissena polymorpha TaxID=45954 RepID=A0A9D4HMP4_DREPO|nr:hypothetical protein DPMN_050087 [Dreissena polymorpha]